MERAESAHGGSGGGAASSGGAGGSSGGGGGAVSASGGAGAPGGNQPPYVTLIPVEYPRRTYGHQNEYQYSDYRSREEYYGGGQTQSLQPDSGAHLYSVSQRLPPAPPYSPLGRHDDWGSQRQLPADGKENSLESLEKQSAAGSNSSSCSNQASSSNGTTSTARLDPPIPSSSSSASSAASPPLSGSNISLTPVCIYLMSRDAIQMDMEDPKGCTVQYMLRNIITCEEMGFNQPCKSLVPNVFSIWLSSPLLELQLKCSHKPWEMRRSWKTLIKKYSHGTPNQQMRDEPIIRFQRNVFYPRHEEEKIKEGRIIELLYEEAREHVIKGRYPCGSARAVALGALQARIQLGPYDPLIHTAHFFRQRQKDFLPAHLRRGWLWMGARSSKAGAEARLLEQFRRAPATAPPRKLMRKYLELCWPLPFYGAAFFQGQVEQPVRGLTSLITHEDIAVLVAINAVGIYVIDECECTMLLGLRYEELSWECARPSNEANDDCLPCLFLQFMVVENGLRVTKILQVFSRQALLMEPLIVHFVGEFKKRLATEEGQRAESPQQYDYQNSPVGVEGGGDMDSPARRLANKTARLSLATFDERGVALGHAGSWRLTY